MHICEGGSVFIKVGFLMSRQITRLCESFATPRETAHVGLFSCVSAHVGTEVKVKREALPADLALIRLLALPVKQLTVWTSIWRFSFELSRNLLLQTVHRYYASACRSPWVSRCFRNEL